MRTIRASVIMAVALAAFAASASGAEKTAEKIAPTSPETREEVVFWLPSGSHRVQTVTITGFAALLGEKLHIRTFRALSRISHERLARDLAPLRVSVNGMRTRLGALRASVLAAQLIRGAAGQKGATRLSTETLRDLARSVKPSMEQRPEA